MTNKPERSKDHSLTIKLAMVLAVGLVFLIASFFVNSAISDRKTLLNKAKADIALSWAGPQTIRGPVLIVPYTDNLKKDHLSHMIFLPNTLSVTGTSTPEVRHRGIFDVYNAEISVQSSSAALSKQFSGLHAQIQLANENQPLNIALKINIKGTESLSFLPVAKESKVDINSNWPDPSFIGTFLPNTKDITNKGFQAQWAISSIASSLPENFSFEELSAHKASFDKTLGVRFLKTADHYQQTERTSKYSFLFVLYTFLVFFLFEVVSKTKIHIFQYFITACSLLCFSILLAAIAEHVPFEVAYAITSLAVITQMEFYVFGILHKKYERIAFVGLLACLYLYLFIVLRLEEIAFLIGAIGMFAAITIAMYFTKNVKWSD